ncbi:MAG TPA: hypothetical protein ENF55_05155 [Thermoprotei archaeon]|nr:MAG: hypothetical protein DRJ63_09145 [Thermoprotei archaeon]HDI75327.1 hypothetical protein [Thermoprotei archaeon]
MTRGRAVFRTMVVYLSALLVYLTVASLNHYSFLLPEILVALEIPVAAQVYRQLSETLLN